MVGECARGAKGSERASVESGGWATDGEGARGRSRGASCSATLTEHECARATPPESLSRTHSGFHPPLPDDAASLSSPRLDVRLDTHAPTPSCHSTCARAAQGIGSTTGSRAHTTTTEMTTAGQHGGRGRKRTLVRRDGRRGSGGARRPAFEVRALREGWRRAMGQRRRRRRETCADAGRTRTAGGGRGIDPAATRPGRRLTGSTAATCSLPGSPVHLAAKRGPRRSGSVSSGSEFFHVKWRERGRTCAAASNVW